MIDFIKEKNKIYEKNKIDKLMTLLYDPKIINSIIAEDNKENSNIIIKNIRENIKLSTDINKIYLYCEYIKDIYTKIQQSDYISNKLYELYNIIELDFEVFITNNFPMPDNTLLIPINNIDNCITILNEVMNKIKNGADNKNESICINLYNYLFSSQDIDDIIKKKVVN